MAYDRKKLIKQALEMAAKYKLIFLDDVIALLPCDKTTFYAHNLNESNELKEIIEQNKVNMKVGMRKKWYESDSATLQVCLYKLCANEEETRKLNNTQAVTVEDLDKISDNYKKLAESVREIDNAKGENK
jgi:hypothetical protein